MKIVNQMQLSLHIPERHNIIPMLLLLLLLGVGAGCKPTEKNYRSAYDVAREKRERDRRHQEELGNDMGIGGGEIRLSDSDATLTRIGEREVLTRNLNFSRADSVGTYAVSVATFRMEANARAMARDLSEDGWPDTRAAHGGESYFVVVGSSAEQGEAMEILTRFEAGHKEWQYVGQPGILMIIGGSR